MTPADARVLTRREGISRAVIEQHLADAPDGLTISELSERLGRHPNTVRGHLDVLVSRGQITRRREDPAGPGRPRMRYELVPTTRVSTALSSLAAAVARQLSPSTDPSITRRAGEQWAREVSPPEGGPTLSIDEAIEQLLATMREVGYRCELDPAGERIYLTHCPYAAMLAIAPAICDLHLYLAQTTLADRTRGVTAERLDVGVLPDLCVLHLRRDDRQPLRSVVATRTDT